MKLNSIERMNLIIDIISQNIKTRELAEKLDVSSSEIYNVLYGDPCNATSVQRVAHAISVDDLLEVEQ